MDDFLIGKSEMKRRGLVHDYTGEKRRARLQEAAILDAKFQETKLQDRPGNRLSPMPPRSHAKLVRRRSSM